MNPADALKPAAVGGFSFLDMFLTAHPVVKFVMLGLIFASVWAWAIIIEKFFAFRRARREADRFEQQFWSGQSLEELYAALSRGRTFSMASLFVAAMREWKRSVEGNVRALGGIQMRVEKVMDVTISREMERLDRRLLFLATVGSTAPFVGLFGTVMGILGAFNEIAEKGNATIATVAAPIGNALLEVDFVIIPPSLPGPLQKQGTQRRAMGEGYTSTLVGSSHPYPPDAQIGS